MIDLASPYTHASADIRRHRYWEACRATAALLRAGHIVFSPIVHSHPLVDHGLATDWDWWARIDAAFLERCDEVVVLTLDGRRDAVGVGAEIRLAEELGKPVRYLAPEDASSSPTRAHVAWEARS